MHNQTLLRKQYNGARLIFTGYEYTQEMFIDCIHYNVMSWYFEDMIPKGVDTLVFAKWITRLYKRYSDLWHEDVVILVLKCHIWSQWYSVYKGREDVSKDNKDLESYDFTCHMESVDWNMNGVGTIRTLNH